MGGLFYFMITLLTDVFFNRPLHYTEEQKNDLYQVITHELVNLVVIIAVSIMFNYKITIPVIMFSALTHANNKIKYDLKYEKEKMKKISQQRKSFSIVLIIIGLIFIYIFPAYTVYITQNGIADKIVDLFKYFLGIVFTITIIILNATGKLHHTVSWLVINISQPVILFYISKFIMYTLFSRMFLFVKWLSDTTHF